MVVDYFIDFYYFEEPDGLRKTILWLVSESRFEPCTSRIRRGRTVNCNTTLCTKLGSNIEVMPTKHSTLKEGNTKSYNEHTGGPKVGIQYIVNYCIPTFGLPCIMNAIICVSTTYLLKHMLHVSTQH